MTLAVPPTDHDPPVSLERVMEPVREALLADAVSEADRIESEAAGMAHDLVTAARTEIGGAVEHARRRAALSARAHADQVLARARSDAHRVVLTTRRRLHQQLIDAVHDSVEEVRADTRYPALLDHLESLARGQLGDDAVVQRDPKPGGGVVAVCGSRRVDYRLPVLADRALETLADEVAQLWR